MNTKKKLVTSTSVKKRVLSKLKKTTRLIFGWFMIYRYKNSLWNVDLGSRSK
jgi:hypothetical protein